MPLGNLHSAIKALCFITMSIKEILEKSKKINLLKENPTCKKVAEVVVAEALNPLIEKVESQFQQNDLEHTQIVETVGEQLTNIKSEFDQKLSEIELTPGEKGDPGDKPVAGVDYEIPQDGQDYVLTEEDKTEIASKIEVPVVEKLVEKTEVIKEQPIVTNEIKEVAKYETAEQIADKLNTLEERVDIKVIKGLKKWLETINRAAREQKKLGGGGMGNFQHESFALTPSTTYVDVAYNIAGNGYAVVGSYYQGGNVFRGVGYTVTGTKRINLLFTPQDNTYFDIIYIRT